MLARHKQLMGSFERARDFLVANPPPNATPAYTAQLEQFESLIARLNALLSDQAAGRKESRDDTGRQQLARRALRVKHLAPISRIARAVLADDPVVRKALAMPNSQMPTMKLLAEAEGFRASAAKYEEAFVQAGRPADFLARLDAAIEALRGTVLGRAKSVGRHVGAKAGLTQELRRARRVLTTLDVYVADAFSTNAELLAKWKIAKRVQNLPGSPGPRATGGTADENVATEPVAA